METRLPWRPTRGSLTSPSYLVRKRTLGPPLENNPKTPPPFIDAHRYDHATITTLLLVTTEETRLEDLIARKVGAGDLGAVANTVLLMGREKVGNRIGRFLGVAKHRGS